MRRLTLQDIDNRPTADVDRILSEAFHSKELEQVDAGVFRLLMLRLREARGSAPELLEALKEILKLDDREGFLNDFTEQLARAAIAKAEGES
jgi:hypothetical protein